MWQTALALLIGTCASMSAKETGQAPSSHAQNQLRANAPSTKEKLALRRLKFFIASAELEIAQQQSAAFLLDYPESESTDTVRGWSVDIALCQSRWDHALKCFDQIQDKDLKARKLPLAMHSLYCLERSADLVEIGNSALWSESLKLVKKSDPLKFYRAEALFNQKEPSEPLKRTEPDGPSFQHTLLLYRELIGGPYTLRALEALADLHCRLGQVGAAEQCVEELGILDPEHSKTLHFDALQALIECDSGLRAFEQTAGQDEHIDLDQRTLRWLALCFDLRRFDQVIRDAEEMIPQLSHRAQPLCALLVGQSFVRIGKYQESIAPLQSYLDADRIASERSKGDLQSDRSKMPDQECKGALLSLLQGGVALRDPKILDRVIAQWLEKFPPSEEIAQALFQRARFCQASDPMSALADLSQIAKEFPDSPLQRDALTGAIALAGRLGKWRICSDLGVDLIERDPRNPKIADLCPLLVQAIARDCAEGSCGETGVSDDRLAPFNALLLLKSQGALAPAQLNQRYLELADALHASGCDRAAQMWFDMVKGTKTPSPQQPPPANREKANGLGEYEAAYVGTINQSIQDGAALGKEDRLALYQALFNSCVQQYAKGSLAQCESVRALAAQALFGAFEAGFVPNQTNLIWLGDYYYSTLFTAPFSMPLSAVIEGAVCQPQDFLPAKIFKDGDERQRADRAIAIYRKLLEGEKGRNGSDHQMDPDLEQSAFRCARLLGAVSEPAAQLALLVHLNEHYKEHPQGNWLYKERAQFELALIADSCGESKLASESYHLIFSKSNASQQMLDWMRWRSAINDLKSGRASRAKDRSPSCLRAHRTLQQLQLRRLACAEPLYLEAALLDADDGVDTSHGAREQKAFEGIKQLFAQSGSDIAGREYHLILKQQPSHEDMHRSYMRWIDARIAQLIAERGGEQSIAQSEFSQTIFAYLEKMSASAPLIALRAAHEVEKTQGGKAR